MLEKIDKIIDESKDKEYFTITPNIIINGYSAIESGVYTYIKRRAGENGEFYERASKSADNLKIRRNTFKRIRNKFVKDGKLKYIGEVKENTNQQGGRQTVKVYKITNIWKENIKTYKGGQNVPPLRPKGGQNVTTKGGQNVPPKNIPNDKNIIVNVIDKYKFSKKDVDKIKYLTEKMNEQGHLLLYLQIAGQIGINKLEKAISLTLEDPNIRKKGAYMVKICKTYGYEPQKRNKKNQ